MRSACSRYWSCSSNEVSFDFFWRIVAIFVLFMNERRVKRVSFVEAPCHRLPELFTRDGSLFANLYIWFSYWRVQVSVGPFMREGSDDFVLLSRFLSDNKVRSPMLYLPYFPLVKRPRVRFYEFQTRCLLF